jgi:DNA-binding HxlR family transcriptional regulator
VRAGAFALSLLSVPLNAHVLRVLDEEPKSLIDLRRAVGSPPQTTMRSHLRTLTGLQVLERRQQSSFPGSIDYQLGPAARGLLEVAGILESWLADAPDGPIELGEPAAKSTVKALVDGWSTAIVRALSARPLTLTELNKLITGTSYPSLERRLGAMRLAGQIEARSGPSRGTPYAATAWLRRAVAPLLAAARWEREFARTEAAPLSRIDFEAAFLLSTPLLDLPDDCTGRCRLAVVSRNGEGEPSVAGAMVTVEEGRVVSCVSRLPGEASAWVAGSPAAWVPALIDHETEQLELGGACDLARTIVDELHGSLFRVRQVR